MNVELANANRGVNKGAFSKRRLWGWKNLHQRQEKRGKGSPAKAEKYKRKIETRRSGKSTGKKDRKKTKRMFLVVSERSL